VQLNTHFSLEEFTWSDYAVRHGIDNTPSSDVLANLLVSADGFDRVRTVLAMPIQIVSGYRAPKVNAGVGGAKTSQHCLGQAGDARAPQFGTPRECCLAIVAAKKFVHFDQLIWEGSWFHCSFVDDRPPRGDILTAHFGAGLTTYTRGIA
jgi:zinc D-Ala-D-Ala carboxypeptidase